MYINACALDPVSRGVRPVGEGASLRSLRAVYTSLEKTVSILVHVDETSALVLGTWNKVSLAMKRLDNELNRLQSCESKGDDVPVI